VDYRIQRGDTLSALAKQFNTTVERLARVNGIEDPDCVAEGKTLHIPDGFDDVVEPSTPPATWTPPGNIDFGPRPPPPPPGGPTGVRGLGTLSARYESNGNPGTVSSGRGDPGDVSYGTRSSAPGTSRCRAVSSSHGCPGSTCHSAAAW